MRSSRETKPAVKIFGDGNVVSNNSTAVVTSNSTTHISSGKIDVNQETVAKLALQAMVDVLFTTSLSEITLSFLRIMISDLRKIIEHYRASKNSRVVKNLNDAYVKLSLAMMLFEKEVKNKEQIERRFMALIETREILEKTLDLI